MTQPAALATLAARGSGWQLLGAAGQTLASLAVTVTLARLLRPAEFGLVNAALAVVLACGVLSGLGIGPALVQRGTLETRHVRAALALGLALSAGLAAGLVLVSPAVEAAFRMPGLAPVLAALAPLFVLGGLGACSEALLTRELRFRELTACSLAGYVVGYGGLGIPLALAGAGVWALVGAQLAQALVRTLLLLHSRPPGLPRFEGRAARELLGYGLGHTGMQGWSFLADQGDNLVVGRVLGAAALGLYGRAFQLLAFPASVFSSVLETVLFPVLSRVQGDARRLARAHRAVGAGSALLLLPGSVLLCLLAPELVRVLLGAGWEAVALPLQILAWGLLPRFNAKIGKSVCKATGAVGAAGRLQVLFAALVLVGAAAGARAGLAGVALGVLGASLVNSLLMTRLSLRLSGLGAGEFLRSHRPAVWGALLAAGVTLLARQVSQALALPDLAGLLLAVTAVGAAALLAAWRWPGVFLGEDGAWLLTLARRAGARAPQESPPQENKPPHEPPPHGHKPHEHEEVEACPESVAQAHEPLPVRS